MVKDLSQIARVHPLSAAAAAVGQVALVREGAIEGLRNSSGERIVELECMNDGFADHEELTHRREIGSCGNLGNIAAISVKTWLKTLFSRRVAATLRATLRTVRRYPPGAQVFPCAVGPRAGDVRTFS